MSGKKHYNCLDFKSSFEEESTSLIENQMVYFCPLCGNKMKIAYIQQRVCYCEQCEEVFEVFMMKSKISYEEVKDDGW